jgi:SAM-dependent methyltransferase
MRSWLYKKISKDAYKKYLGARKTKKKTLIVFREIDFKGYFPHSKCVHYKKGKDVDLVLKTYEEFYKLPYKDAEYDCIVAFGILEHLKDHERFMKELSRILKKNGTLILSCASVMSVHEAPTHFTNLTEFGMKELLKDWEIKDISPHSNSFTTLAVLLQRIAYQSESSALFKAIILLIAKGIPYLQIFVGKEYGDISRKHRVKSMMPLYVFATAKKK